MESVSSCFVHKQSAAQQTIVSTIETPVVGKPKCRRVNTTSKTEDGTTISVLIEELENGRLLSRHYDQYLPVRLTCKELFESDGTVISS